MPKIKCEKEVEICNELDNIIKNIKHSPRPLTTKEIKTKTKIENKSNLHRKLNRLIKYGIIKKVKFKTIGYTLKKR